MKLRASNGVAAGGGEGEHAAEGEDVARGTYGAVVELLGGQERGGADDHPGGGQPRIAARARGLRDAEVDDPGAVVGHDDVERLEVPVNQATGVNGVQALGERGGQLVHRRRVEGAIALDPGLQGRARDVLR